MMPRWSDGGNLGHAEQLMREFGSGLVEPWGFWLIPECYAGGHWIERSGAWDQ